MKDNFKKLCPLAAIVSFVLCVFAAIQILQSASYNSFEQAVGVFFAGVSVFVLFALFALAGSAEKKDCSSKTGTKVYPKRKDVVIKKETKSSKIAEKQQPSAPQNQNQNKNQNQEQDQNEDSDSIKRYNGDSKDDSGPLTLYIANLSEDTSELDIREEFEVFGAVKSVKLVADPETGSPKGYAFVEMANKAEAELALEDINGQQIKGQEVKVSYARRKNRGRPYNRRK